MRLSYLRSLAKPSTVLAVQKVLSGSGRARRLHLMEKYIRHRLVA